MGDSLESLVAEFLDRRERGEVLEAAEFARAHPQHAERLLAVLATLSGIEARMDAARELAPKRIGPYSVQREIARGGMGRVLEVVDPRQGELRLALKLLDGAAALSARGRERFAREAQALRELRHPGVVRVFEAGADGAVPWLAMELVQGETIAARVERARAEREAGGAPPYIPIAEAVSIAARLARALEAVHAAGLVHRDVKPANVIQTPQGRIVLIDFGMVRDETADTLTRTGDLLGTPQYMSPEQARGGRADTSSDVYGAGAVLYELLTLEPPHGGAEPLQVLERARRLPIRPARRLAPHVPRELEWILRSALAFRRGRRLASAGRLAADLEAFLEGRPLATRAPGAFERMEDACRLHRSKLLAAGLVAVLLCAALFGLLDARRRAREADRRRVEDALIAWIGEERELGVRLAPKLSGLQRQQPFAPLLAALLLRQDPPASGDPAVEAAGLGWTAAEAGKQAQGLEQLQRARALAPQSPIPVVLLARAAERAGMLDLAAREYRAASEMLPGRAALHARLASVHYSRKDDTEAERSIRAALALEPSKGDYYFSLARVLSRQKRAEEGLEAALRGKALAGTATSVSGLQILAALFDDAQRYGEAQQVLLDILERRPGDVKVLYNLAISYMSDHRYFDALETCRRIDRGVEQARALASQAWMLAGSNVAKCERCKRLYAEHPELLDPAAAERLALEALALEFSNEVPMVCAQVAQLTGRSEALRARLQELQDGAQDDARIAALERALRELR
jgi:tetratricopeptide (TPR) repeat protein